MTTRPKRLLAISILELRVCDLARVLSLSFETYMAVCAAISLAVHEQWQLDPKCL